MATDERFDWVENTTKVAALFGFNPIRVRFKLQRLADRWAHRVQRAGLSAKHLAYEHQTCPECGRVLDRSERRCPGCDAALGARPLHLLRRLGLVSPRVVSASALLAAAIMLAYARVMVANQGAGLMGFSSLELVRYGALFGPAFHAGEWWRPATAIFMHIGVLHLGFNLVALMQIGPGIEELFGRGRMLVAFMLTGIAGFLLGDWLNPEGLTAGASGAIMGLAGMAAGWGQQDGTSAGREVRNRMLKWLAYTTLFGLMAHVNHAAHFGGFISGGLLGLVLSTKRKQAPRLVDIGLASVGLGAVVATFVMTIAPMPSALVQVWQAMERTQTAQDPEASPQPAEAQPDQVIE